MELWIRSQSKLSLVEAKTLTIIEREGKWHIVKLNALINLEYRIELGIYKTKERALEVLDEIQNMLIKNQPHVLTYTDGNIVNIDGNLVYEMPKE